MGLGDEFETVIPMDGEDHRSIVRYESKESPSYGKVLACLKEAVNEATNRQSPSPTNPKILS
jgi:hypothetical protein